MNLGPRCISSPLLGSSLHRVQLTYSATWRRKNFQGSAEAVASGLLTASSSLGSPHPQGRSKTLPQLFYGGMTVPTSLLLHLGAVALCRKNNSAPWTKDFYGR